MLSPCWDGTTDTHRPRTHTIALHVQVLLPLPQGRPGCQWRTTMASKGHPVRRLLPAPPCDPVQTRPATCTATAGHMTGGRTGEGTWLETRRSAQHGCSVHVVARSDAVHTQHSSFGICIGCRTEVPDVICACSCRQCVLLHKLLGQCTCDQSPECGVLSDTGELWTLRPTSLSGALLQRTLQRIFNWCPLHSHGSLCVVQETLPISGTKLVEWMAQLAFPTLFWVRGLHNNMNGSRQKNFQTRISFSMS